MKVGSGAPELESGRIIAGKYRVERVLGKGGQGTVVAAMHLRLRQRVAIKIPHIPENDSGEAAARLLREARAVFRLQSEHVARIVDVDVVNGAPFVVMEYLEGVDLKKLLARQGPLPVADAIGFVVQACDALAEAHDLGIVHRDLKPSNLFVLTNRSGAPTLKVLDFGLSKVETRAAHAHTDDGELTQPALVLGSPRYMSPEQIRDPHDVDSRTDIWSLGTVLQEALTGQPVFRARNEREVLAQILRRERMPLSLLRADVPTEIERVVWRCTQREREHRFANVREVVRAVAPYAPDWAALDIQRLLGSDAAVDSDIRSRPLGDGAELVTPTPPKRARRSFWGANALGVSLGVSLAAALVVAAWAAGMGRLRLGASVEGAGLVGRAQPSPRPSSAETLAPPPVSSRVELIRASPAGLAPGEGTLAVTGAAIAPADDANLLATAGKVAVPLAVGAPSPPFASGAVVRRTTARRPYPRTNRTSDGARGASSSTTEVPSSRARREDVGQAASAPDDATAVPVHGPVDDPLDGRK